MKNDFYKILMILMMVFSLVFAVGLIVLGVLLFLHPKFLFDLLRIISGILCLLLGFWVIGAFIISLFRK